MANAELKIFNKGVHNLLDKEIIPKEALSNSKNWYTQDGRLKTVSGRTPVGAEGTIGAIYGEIFGYRVDGTTVHWRKAGTKIQYLNGSTWTDVVTGLTSTADYSFFNYNSLAGAFTYAFGVDGIYKFNNANPGSFCSMYDSTKNFKGKAITYGGRTILWDLAKDKTGLYGSYIDAQNSTVYTQVTGEATVSLGGTLAFKAGGATRNCFNVQITLTGTGEVYTDNYNGVLTGSLGGTGTINYITGTYTVTNAGVGTVNYQWEDSNVKGLTDFTKSATRLAGEGFQFPQEQGGDPILNVLIGLDDAIYSMKSSSTYRLFLDADDITADNQVYRKELGVPSYRASTSIQTGIVFMNTANIEKPEMTILVRNPIGGNVEPLVMFSQFKFANYDYTDCTIDNYERYILVACRQLGSSFNDVILLCNQEENTVDIIHYQARTFVKSSGYLYCGSPITESVYKLFDGFDDVGLSIQNFIETKAEDFGASVLKKERKLRIKGNISLGKSAKVYLDYDNAGYNLIGTIVSTADYVDLSSPQTIGSNIIGVETIGGSSGTTITTYPYFAELRLKKVPKFRVRTIKVVAEGFGYIDINYLMDWDLSQYGDKIPARYRQKQNVSISGLTTNLPAPEF